MSADPRSEPGTGSRTEADTDRIDAIEPYLGNPPDRRGAAERPVDAQLVVLVHPDRRRLGQRVWLEIGHRMEIGRSDAADLSLDEIPSVSRRHARLIHEGATVRLEDLGSTNGTLVNDRQVVGPGTVLRHGDRLQMGGAHLRFLLADAPEVAYQEVVREVVTRDGLTETLQTRVFLDEVEREIERGRRYRRPVSLAVHQVEEFDRLDQEFGSLCGDFVLRRIGLALRGEAGLDQALGRVGLAEFARLLPESDEAGAWQAARRFDERVARSGFHCAGVAVPVRLATGVGCVAPEATPADLLSVARSTFTRLNAGA